VAQTDAQLFARVSSQPTIRGASSFTNRTVAEFAIAEAIDVQFASIARWFKGKRNKLVLEESLATAVGRVLPRGATEFLNVSRVRVYLKRDSFFVTGYRIQTGYPIP
jgi:hypothetical protein